MVNYYHIGTSGWYYPHWRSNFYPETLPKNEWLSFYTKYFSTVEINSSFYRLPEEDTLNKWSQIVPSEFCFSVKVSRFITHIKRLKDSQENIENFITRIQFLQKSLGPLLYQIPPAMHLNRARLAAFLSLLDKNLKHVFEFRHPSWMTDEIFNLLKQHRVGFCIYDMPEYTSPFITTSDFAYIRFHGFSSLYSGKYPDSVLYKWSTRIKEFSSLNRIYIYFNNDAHGFAIQNARTLKSYLED